MKSRQLLAVVVVLAILGGGYWWATRWAPSKDAREYSALENVDPPAVTSRTTMQKQEPAVAVVPPGEKSQRATAPVPPPDFEKKYGQMSSEDLHAALMVLSGEAFVAGQARLGELFPKFPELLAQGSFGARVIPDGENFEGSEGAFGGFRLAKNAEGIEEAHYLELFAGDDPAIAALVAEEDWVAARIATLNKKD